MLHIQKRARAKPLLRPGTLMTSSHTFIFARRLCPHAKTTLCAVPLTELHGKSPSPRPLPLVADTASDATRNKAAREEKLPSPSRRLRMYPHTSGAGWKEEVSLSGVPDHSTNKCGTANHVTGVWKEWMEPVNNEVSFFPHRFCDTKSVTFQLYFSRMALFVTNSAVQHSSRHFSANCMRQAMRPRGTSRHLIKP
jgi:hypothetical protein